MEKKPIIEIVVEFLRESKDLQELYLRQTILKRGERNHPDIVSAIKEMEEKLK